MITIEIPSAESIKDAIDRASSMEGQLDALVSAFDAEADEEVATDGN